MPGFGFHGAQFMTAGFDYKTLRFSEEKVSFAGLALAFKPKQAVLVLNFYVIWIAFLI